MCLCVCTHVFVYEGKKKNKKTVWFIATWQTPAHFSKSISAPEGNLHGTIYEAEFTISVQLLGPTEETAADMNLLEQRHLVVSRCCACVCVWFAMLVQYIPQGHGGFLMWLWRLCGSMFVCELRKCLLWETLALR